MITYEVYGNPKNPILCLLPGAGLGIWAYKQLIPLLTKKFCIIFPNILTNFTDMNNAVQQLHDLIIHKQWRIQLLAGLSIGSQIALKLVATYPCICSNLLLESCAVFPQKFSNLIKPITNFSFPLTRYTLFNKLQAKVLHLPKNEYQCYDQEIKKMSKQTLINMLISNTHFDIKNLKPISFQGKTLVVYGTKENKLIIKSSYYLSKEFKNVKLISLKNYYHGDLTLNHPTKFLEIVKENL